MRGTRELLVTCDDLGYHPTLNDAIVDILSRGVVRAASLMAAAPHFHDALRRMRDAGLTRVGVHLTLGSEYPRLPIAPLSPRDLVESLVDASGRFPRDITERRDQLVAEEVEIELRAQIERVRRAKLEITHLDGHMFCYEPEVGGPRVCAVAEALASEYRLPLRRRSPPAGTGPAVRMLWKEALGIEQRCACYSTFLEAFRGPLTELIVHPGKDLDAMRRFSATGERRLADYLFFSSDRFADLVRTHDIRIVGHGDG